LREEVTPDRCFLGIIHCQSFAYARVWCLYVFGFSSLPLCLAPIYCASGLRCPYVPIPLALSCACLFLFHHTLRNVVFLQFVFFFLPIYATKAVFSRKCLGQSLCFLDDRLCVFFLASVLSFIFSRLCSFFAFLYPLLYDYKPNRILSCLPHYEFGGEDSAFYQGKRSNYSKE